VQGVLRLHRRYDVGENLAEWGSIPIVFPPGMAGQPGSPYRTCDIMNRSIKFLSVDVVFSSLFISLNSW